MPPITMPDTTQCPDGPPRAFVAALHALYRDAGSPGTRMMATAIKNGPDSRGTISHQAIADLLHGRKVPGWQRVEPLVLLLAERSVYRPDPQQAAVRLFGLWEYAKGVPDPRISTVPSTTADAPAPTPQTHPVEASTPSEPQVPPARVEPSRNDAAQTVPIGPPETPAVAIADTQPPSPVAVHTPLRPPTYWFSYETWGKPHSFIQPAALSQALIYKMFAATIATPVDLTAHTDLLGTRLAGELLRRFPSGRAALWGVPPGRNNANLRKALRIEPGNQAFLSGDKKLYLSGQVAATFHNPALARRLWGADQVGNSWEFMYAIDAVREHHLPMDEVRELLGWQPNRNVQNLTHLSDTESALLAELLQLDPPAVTEDLEAGPGQDPTSGRTLLDTDIDTDIDPDFALAGTRTYQQRLRRHVLARTSACALCQRHVPAGLLMVHAMKSPMACSEAERRSLDNAMPLCALGCRELFEQGYLAVAPGGDIRFSTDVTAAPELVDCTRRYLAPPRTSWWTPEREPFYAWHREHVFRRPPTA
ncbi:hypothetical protein ACFZBU_46670 [Embleya sp. NPDC008237]|uniref:hypothetical protein n=1 Tax=Embleya sp. NPDC008237 TaxID=3363978 RepID=UPI0036EE2FBC